MKVPPASARQWRAGASLAAVGLAVIALGVALISAESSIVNAAEPNGTRNRERVIKVIVEQFGFERSALSDGTNLCALPGIDSLKRVELVLALDEEFGIHIPDAEIDCLCVIADIVYFVTNRKRNPQAAICRKVD